MASCVHLTLLGLLALLPIFGAGDTCLSPSVKSEVYTTTDASISTETVVVAEFTLTCKNALSELNLYAEFNGKTVPACKVQGSTDKYQVSFSGEHKKIPSGTHNIRVFDEEGYGNLRKAQRSGDDTSSIKSLLTVQVSHPGASHGQYLQSEFVATAIAVLVWYTAYTTRAKLQRS